MSPSDAGRYWRTLRFLSPKQLAWFGIRRVLKWPRAVRQPSSVSMRAGVQFPEPLPTPSPRQPGPGRFRFLNRERAFQGGIDWSAPGEPRLWKYNLHYFDWLRDATHSESDFMKEAESWCTANEPFHGTGWEPYPISLRLVNWAFAMAKAGRNTPVWLLDSFALQSRWLSSNLEHHLRANHLFVNGKALVYAGMILAPPFGDTLLRRGQALLEQEIPEQFLDDGGHFERSPMYHALLTGDLLELHALASANPGLFSPGFRVLVERTACAALDFAGATTMPDGSLPLFNDSAQDIAPPFAVLAAYAEKTCGFELPQIPDRDVRAFSDSGYFLVRDNTNLLIFDCGEIGPSYQPGHAHCDMLSFELCLAGRRVIADVGNFDYEPGHTRRFARSTRAHNTIEIDEREQSEIWGAFRVGRRARPFGANVETEIAEGTVRITGAHDGYRAAGIIHKRQIDIAPGFEITVRDTVEGRGRHRIANRIHFAPGLDIALEEDKARVTYGDNPFALIQGLSATNVRVDRTERYPEFGRIEPGKTLVYESSEILPFEMHYRILPA